MPRIKEISDYLEALAPLHLQENYDNAGLIVGDPETEISGILINLDATEAVVDEAIQKSFNLIIVHHPIIFGGLKKINNHHYVERTVRKAIKNDIAIYAAHTNLDNIVEGVNKQFALQLNLSNLKILQQKDHDGQIGSGMIGQLQKPLGEIEFLKYLKDGMSTPLVRHTPFLGKKIEKVAICGGAGSFLIKQAIASGAQAFITGDIKYHEFFEANDDILICDIGHYESEQFTREIFRQVLSEKFTNIALQFSEVHTNPINYFY